MVSQAIGLVVRRNPKNKPADNDTAAAIQMPNVRTELSSDIASE